MSHDERLRTIPELAARYKLEPTLRDVYVEGPYDALLIKESLRIAGCRNAAVYAIDTVDVPTEKLIARKLKDGSKGRVVALCLELGADAVLDKQVTGVIDRDDDDLLGVATTSRLLLRTDYTCMEMYFFDEVALGRYCERFLRKEPTLAKRLLEMLKGPLPELFYIRATNEALVLGLTWLATEGQVTLTNKGKLEFKPDTFVERYLNKGGMADRKTEFLAKRNELRAKAHADPRHNVHGHDFVHLLAKCLHPELKNKALADPEVVERGLAASADHLALNVQPMFQELITRVRD